MSHVNLSATEARKKIDAGLLSCVDLVAACFKRIEETDDQIKAWVSLDKEGALARAAELDEIRKSGYPTGKLHGLPVGLKDIIDTKTMPTQCGTPVFAGRQPDEDATLVDRLTEAGAIIIGKTVTTEMAFMHPSVTKNPHNLEHTPGGSSSGSAAAVASYQVPLAIGTQTNGSVIRPASFCGTYGFKPSRGIISRRGILQTSKSLDQVGVFARTLEDVALLSDALGSYDPADQLSLARPRASALAGYQQEVPVTPSLVWLEMPYHDRLSSDSVEGIEEFLSELGADVERVPAPDNFNNLIEAQKIIHQYEYIRHLSDIIETRLDDLSVTLQRIIEGAKGISDDHYAEALSYMEAANGFFKKFFYDYDAVLAPSAAGEAPLLSDGTGDPIFCTVWTLCGLPCLSLPLLSGSNGLPIGIQVIGQSERDDRLLRTSRWIENKLNNVTPDKEA